MCAGPLTLSRRSSVPPCVLALTCWSACALHMRADIMQVAQEHCAPNKHADSPQLALLAVRIGAMPVQLAKLGARLPSTKSYPVPKVPEARRPHVAASGASRSAAPPQTAVSTTAALQLRQQATDAAATAREASIAPPVSREPGCDLDVHDADKVYRCAPATSRLTCQLHMHTKKQSMRLVSLMTTHMENESLTCRREVCNAVKHAVQLAASPPLLQALQAESELKALQDLIGEQAEDAVSVPMPQGLTAVKIIAARKEDGASTKRALKERTPLKRLPELANRSNERPWKRCKFRSGARNAAHALP